MNMQRRGMSLLELLAAVTILGIVAAIAIPRFGQSAVNAKKRTCGMHKGNIEVQAQLWFRTKGAWPRSDLSDIGANRSFFPDGLPTCPVDSTAYAFDSSTRRVTSHAH